MRPRQHPGPVRGVLASRVVGVLLAAALLLGAEASGAEPGALSFLLVTLDTTRADRLGCYGRSAALTPALDALATRGTLFERAFTSCPMTLPAHATLLTGLQPPEHGLRRNGKDRLSGGISTLAEVLAERDYQTGAFVAAFVLDSRFGLDRGFQTYDDDLSAAQKQTVKEPLSVYRTGNLVTDAALAWLGRVVDPGGRPFFCWVHLYDPHYPYIVHAELAGTRLAGAASYDAEIAFVDRQVARLLGFLAEHRLAERTLVVVVGDHGEGLGDHGEVEHGYLLNNEALQVPLIISLPGVVREGQRVTAVVSLVDLFPTVLEVLGVPRSPQGTGRSLAPALRGERVASLPSYAETDLPYTAYGWSPLRGLTTPAWRYVRTTRPELYDRLADPQEQRNLARARPDQVRELDTTLAETETKMTLGAAARAAPGPEERRRLEALGYVQGGESPAPAVTPASLPDIKTMLPVKHFDAKLTNAIAAGTIGQERILDVARKLVWRSPGTARFHHVLGTALLHVGRDAEAAEQLSEAVRLRPDYPEAHTNLGNALARQGKTDDAVAHYTEALRSNPALADAHLGMGNALATQGRLDQAIRQYEDALRLDPEQAAAHFDLANALVRQHRGKAAIQHYQEAIRLKPDFSLAHHNLGLLFVQQEKPVRAMQQFAEAVQLTPDFAAARYNLGKALVEDGRVEEAIEQYTAAVRLNPDNPEFVDNLAAAYASAGRLDEAAATARKAAGLAESAGRPELARDIERRTALYERMKNRREHAQNRAQ